MRTLEAEDEVEAYARAARRGRARVAVVCDLREENWPSMDLVGDALVEGLGAAEGFEAVRVCPPMRRRLSRAGEGWGRRFNADRLLNRFFDYPRALRRVRGAFDLFHVVDHSYAQLVHQLPHARTVVTCHDLDTFRCLLAPREEPRTRAFRLMAARTLAGLRLAARVACDSRATRDQLLAHGLVAPERLAVIPLGVSPIFSPAPDPKADAEAERLLGPPDASRPELLHVGSTIARKRVDVLLELFARVRGAGVDARLVRVGGPLTAGQSALAARLGVAGEIETLPPVSAGVLAAVYRRARVVVQPSEREGFGLPVLEALACGAAVVASDLAVLREVGGDGPALYCAVGDAQSFAAAVLRLLDEDETQTSARRASAAARAAQFTWPEYVRRVTALYEGMLDAA